MIETKVDSGHSYSLDCFANFISRNENNIKNKTFNLETYKKKLLKKIELFISEELGKFNGGLEKFFPYHRELLINDFLLRSILFDTDLFPEFEQSSTKRRFLKAWLEEKFSFALNSKPEDSEEAVEWIWEGYVRGIAAKREKFTHDNCRNFMLVVNYLYCRYEFNSVEKEICSVLIEFFNKDKLFSPHVILSDNSPPYFSQIENYDNQNKPVVFEDIFGNYDIDKNLITLYKPGILWFCEKEKLDFEEVKTISLTCLLIRYFLKDYQYNLEIEEKVSTFLLTHILSLNAPKLCDALGSMELKGNEFTDEFSDEEVNRLDILLKNGCDSEIIPEQNFFQEKRNEKIRDYIVTVLLKDNLRIAGRKFTGLLDLAGLSHVAANIADPNQHLLLEYYLHFKKQYELRITKIRDLKLKKEIRDILSLEKKTTFSSEEEFNEFLQENGLSHLKYILRDHFLQKHSGLNTVSLFPKLNKTYISKKLVNRLVEREKYPKKHLSIDDTGSENDENNPLSNMIKDEKIIDNDDLLVIEETSSKILRILYNLLAIEVDDVNYLRKTCKIFLSDTMGMQKNRVAESLSVQPSVITEIKQKLEVDFIYLFDYKFSYYISKIIEDSKLSQTDSAKLESILGKFKKETLDIRHGFNKLKGLFVETLEKGGIEPNLISKTHYEIIIKALIAFEIKAFYLSFSARYSLDEEQLDTFQAVFINEINNSNRQKVRKLPNIEDIRKKIVEFSIERKIPSLGSISTDEVKELLDFSKRLGIDTSRKVVLGESSLNANDLEKFLRFFKEKLDDKLLSIEEIFFNNILNKDSVTEFSEINPMEKNNIILSFFISAMGNPTLPKYFNFLPEPESNEGEELLIIFNKKELEIYLNEREQKYSKLMKIDFMREQKILTIQDVKNLT